MSLLANEFNKRFNALKQTNPFIIEFLDLVHAKSVEAKEDNKEKKNVYSEDFKNDVMTSVYEDVMNLINLHIKRGQGLHKDQ